jgi:hypothetical protein
VGRLQSMMLLLVLHQLLAVGRLEFIDKDWYGARSLKRIFLIAEHGDSDDAVYR